MAEPLENDIYGEMVPLLQRIDDQQAQLKKQNKELAEAESMRRDFSSNVSHEMKTPLQVISGYAELMKNDMVLPEDRQKFAGLIYDEAQAMRGLINDVLTLSKLDESAFAREERPIDVTSVARRMAGRLESFAADEGVSISVKGAPAHINGSETLAEEMLCSTSSRTRCATTMPAEACRCACRRALRPRRFWRRCARPGRSRTPNRWSRCA